MTETAPATRLAWLDVAKGCCIVLVVLHHVTAKYVPMVVPADLMPIALTWQAISQALKPVRMPVFFVVSGFFAARAIARPWPDVLRRVTSPYYLYLVWLAIYIVFYRIETRVEANRVEDLGDLVSDLWWAETSMWFLFALAAYFALAKLLRPIDPRLVIAVAALVTLWTGWSGIEYNNQVSVLAHFTFFAVGAYYPRMLRWAGELSDRDLKRLAIAYVAAFFGLQASGLPWSVTLAGCSLVGIPLGLAVAARLGRVPLVSDGLGWLGQRTLRVYVLHFAVIGVLAHLPFRVQSSGADGALLAMMLPVLVTAAVIAACIGLHAFGNYYGGAILFRLPRPVERAHALAQLRWGTGQPAAGRSATRSSPRSAGNVPSSESA